MKGCVRIRDYSRPVGRAARLSPRDVAALPGCLAAGHLVIPPGARRARRLLAGREAGRAPLSEESKEE